MMRFLSPSGGYYLVHIVLCLLTSYVCGILLCTKYEDEVSQANMRYVYAKIWGSLKILSESRNELKNTFFVIVVKGLVIKQVSSSPYCQKGIGYIEGFQNFLT